MDSLYLLTALSMTMFAGSFLAGSIPLAFSMSEGRTRLLSTFGAGLLVGTALSVIIPEGIESLYLAETERFISTEKTLLMKNIIVSPEAPDASNESILVKYKDEDGLQRSRHVISVDNGGNKRNRHFETGISTAEINQSIGYSLIIGFIFMLIVDQITRSSFKGAERSRNKMTATIGLVVHAAVDGIALGSASGTNRTDVQFIIFFAIMLHKAPAAFGLVSFLLIEGIERFRIRRHLFTFSVAAPLAAIVTFYLIAALGNKTLTTNLATGKLMLFSAGTFLYVATVHILPELVNSGTDEYQLVNTATESSTHTYCTSSGAPLKLKELISIVIGAMCPAILASSHSHSH